MKYGYYFCGNECYSNELPPVGFFYFIEENDKFIIYKRNKTKSKKIKEVTTYHEASLYNNDHMVKDRNFIILNA